MSNDVEPRIDRALRSRDVAPFAQHVRKPQKKGRRVRVRMLDATGRRLLKFGSMVKLFPAHEVVQGKALITIRLRALA